MIFVYLELSSIPSVASALHLCGDFWAIMAKHYIIQSLTIISVIENNSHKVKLSEEWDKTQVKKGSESVLGHKMKLAQSALLDFYQYFRE